MEIKKERIMAYALKNAVEHEGKAVSGSVIAGLFNEGLKKENIKDIMPLINEVLKEVNSLGIEKQKIEYEIVRHSIGKRPERHGLLDLEGVGKKGIVTRFSPSPSGPMHIGHVFTGMYGSLYTKLYGGKFYFRIEDTNPENIYVPAYKMLKEEGDWIFGNVEEYIIQSDRLEVYYKYLDKLFDKGFAYVCDCDSEKFKELLLDKKECPCRDLNKKEQVLRWKRMLDKNGYKEGEVVVRFKSDLKHPNPAMRDFPLARINTHKHPKQGNKYRVWPLMNLSVSVDDIEYGITHAIRGKDHKDNAERQKLIYSALGVKNYPVSYFMGRYNFTDLDLSATQTRKAIEEGKFSGWDDIRLPFVDALKKRGYQPRAFAKMTEEKGLSEVDKVMTKKDFFDVLDGFNREVLREMNLTKTEFKKTSHEKGDVVILMPDGRKVYGDSDIKPKKDELIYFNKLGYGKFNGTFDGKLLFWFAHK